MKSLALWQPAWLVIVWIISAVVIDDDYIIIISLFFFIFISSISACFEDTESECGFQPVYDYAQ